MLDDIVSATRARVGALDAGALRSAVADAGVRPTRSLETGLAEPGLSVIAEVKRRSPSRGELAAGIDPAGQAQAYEAGGAAAISVLTEPDFFAGSLQDLAAVRASVDIPVLRKDFMVSPAQVWESALGGADVILLIVAILGDDELAELLAEASSAGLDALVEVHTREEAERALAAGARIVGVNNRDLTTFEVDLAAAEKLAPVVAAAPHRIAESGIFSAADAGRMAEAGYDGVLVGEALVRAADPAKLVAELRGSR
ncbi:MAG: indole-3-glycerol phosphate synthase TrpC [Acidimicrobiia bacterium]|nr:indole-3-glycerol phosphate synthase TrpC [Acidimicrobiia bacterium]NNL68921.1 indole-3-glycerol phosphate synthase TrpC [Acidimicrobiia bacterium]